MIHTLTLFDASGDNTAQVLYAGAGKVFYIHAINRNTADAYLQFFDLAAADVTVGTTTPKLSFLVPGGNGTTAGAFEAHFDAAPLEFELRVTYACTTTATGGTNPTTALTLNFSYRTG